MSFRSSRRASWPLQDVSGDVIALSDLSGANASARIVTQLVYDAYGNVIGRDDDPANPSTGPPPPELRVGHKGLFFDRLDAGIFNPSTGTETPRLEAGAKLSGHVRNRTLHCGLGRWNQRDPNMTGLVVQGRIAYHGKNLEASPQEFDIEAHFGDGANVYAYAGHTPFTQNDPTGLFFSMAGQAVMSGLNAYDFASDALASAETGVRTGIGLGAMLMEYQVSSIFDTEWASDWSASDDDYSGGAVIPEEISGYSGGGTDGLEVAGVTTDLNRDLIKVFSGTKHGSDKHYTRMRLETLRYMMRNGLSINDVDIKINKSGPGLNRKRPDIQIFDKTGKLRHAIEVGNTQSLSSLREKIKAIKKWAKKQGASVGGFSMGKKIRIGRK